MSLLVVHPGAGTTIQDPGRTGYRAWGVPVGGAFDRGALDLANALLGNPPDAAALEMSLLGGSYRAQIPLAIALAGAPMAAAVHRADGHVHPLSIPQTASLDAGDRLVFGGTDRGARAYLAVLGGWETPVILGSRSSETRLRAGDVLPAASGTVAVRRPATGAVPDRDDEPIRVVDGPDAVGLEVWEGLVFHVEARSDRMGLRLEGDMPAVEADPDRLSMPVAPGAVQAAGGRLIVLGVAGGTMGGYPHLAQVISADLDRLAQLRPGAEVRLRRISVEEARRIDRDDLRSRRARRLRVAALAADTTGQLSLPDRG